MAIGCQGCHFDAVGVRKMMISIVLPNFANLKSLSPLLVDSLDESSDLSAFSSFFPYSEWPKKGPTANISSWSNLCNTSVWSNMVESD